MPTPPDSRARRCKRPQGVAHRRARGERALDRVSSRSFSAIASVRFSEKIDPDQLALMLEDVDQSIAAGQAQVEGSPRQNRQSPSHEPNRRTAALGPTSAMARDAKRPDNSAYAALSQ